MSDKQFRVAANSSERLAALRLLYESYHRSGLIEPNRFRLRVTPYHLQPRTRVFIAARGNEVLGTMSLLADGPRGLPLESVYREEVAELRRCGRSLGEVSGLAIRKLNEGSMPIFMGISQVLCPLASRQGIDVLLIAVHPRHARFYRRYLNFQTLGAERIYPHVRHRPAVAMFLDFPWLQREHPQTHLRLFGKPCAPGDVQPRPMSRAEYDYLSNVLEASGTQRADLVPVGWDSGATVKTAGVGEQAA